VHHDIDDCTDDDDDDEEQPDKHGTIERSVRRGRSVSVMAFLELLHFCATDQGRNSNDLVCLGRTTVKCRRSSVATTSSPSLSASAMTDASTVPNGRSRYRATSSAG